MGENANKKPSLKKAEENPILLPRDHLHWESWQTFNPAAILLHGRVHFVYRAIGEDGQSRLGYASSDDGIEIDERPPYPVYEHRNVRGSFRYATFASGGSWGGSEDPRITRVGNEDVLYMTYTACDGGLRVGLTSIRLDDFLNKRWRWTNPVIISSPHEVHKNWVIFPEKINGRYAILHSLNPSLESSRPRVAIEYRDSLEFADNEYIESLSGDRRGVRGAGPPPVKTDDGWLLFYQATDHDDPGRYKVRVMLLDYNDPSIVLHVADEPVLEPDESYENDGFKAGIVYASGAVVKDGTIFVYYGASDSYVAVASAPVDEFLTELKITHKPKLQQKRGSFSLLKFLRGGKS